MSQISLNILMIFDVPTPLELDQKELKSLLKRDEDYRDERDVLAALESLGHTVELFAIYDQVNELVKQVTKNGQHYDLIFCLFESVSNERSLAPKLTSLFEVLGIPFTGAKAETLSLCQNKELTKQLLASNGFDVPQSFLVPTNGKLKIPVGFPFPVIIKPVGFDGSEGISSKSIVRKKEQLEDRIEAIRSRYPCDLLVEEFIEGREFYVSLIGHKRPRVFPPQELKFSRLPKGTPRIATYRAKWDQKYRKTYGIDSGRPNPISKKTAKRLRQDATTIFKILDLDGYSRLDFRITEEGKIFFLEANPNPSIKKSDDFSQSAKRAGLSYENIIDDIVNLGLRKSA